MTSTRSCQPLLIINTNMVITDKKREERASRRYEDQAKQLVDVAITNRREEHLRFSLYAHSAYEACPTVEVAQKDDTMETAVQCDEDWLKPGVEDLTEMLKISVWSMEKVKRSDSSMKFYTGHPSFAVFM